MREWGSTRFALVVSIVLIGALTAGCGKKGDRRPDDDNTFRTTDELYSLAQVELNRANLRKARSYLERIQLGPDDYKKYDPLIRLALADSVFYRGDDLSLIEARSKYLDFVTLHGDHPDAPYAQFQAGVCLLLQVRHPSRDQSQTREAIEELGEVVRRWPDSAYAQAARDMTGAAQVNLAEHEFIIGRFYFAKKAYPAAVNRFKRMLDRYPRYAERDLLYYFLGRSLILSDNEVEGRQYLVRLLEDYPNFDQVGEVRKWLERPVANGAPDEESGDPS